MYDIVLALNMRRKRYRDREGVFTSVLSFFSLLRIYSLSPLSFYPLQNRPSVSAVTHSPAHRVCFSADSGVSKGTKMRALKEPTRSRWRLRSVESREETLQVTKLTGGKERLTREVNTLSLCLSLFLSVSLYVSSGISLSRDV